MLIQQVQAVMPLCEVAATIEAGIEFNSINMANYDHAAFYIQFASTLAYTTAPTITMESATSDTGDTADVTFHYTVNTGSAASLSTAMTYAADATASTISYSSAGDLAGHVLLLQVDGDELRSTSLGKVYNWLTVDIDSTPTTGAVAAWAVLSNYRYAGASMPVAI